jgi:hypothetical protein
MRVTNDTLIDIVLDNSLWLLIKIHRIQKGSTVLLSHLYTVSTAAW